MHDIPFLQIIMAVIGTGGALALILVVAKSKLPAATIQIQNESIRALQEQNKLLKENVVELSAVLVELKARVSVLETIPLQKMTDSLTLISQSLARLEASGNGSNITINK